MISAIYASACAILICWLSLNVIKKRHREGISIGHGQCEELETAMAAQSNAIEYIPITLLLLFALEHNQASHWLIHLFGILLLTGRLVHARSFLAGDLNGRVRGMQVTIWTIIALAVANIFYLPFDKLFTL